MAEKSKDEMWDHASLWNDIATDHTGSLMDIMPDAEHMLHMLPEGSEHEQRGTDNEVCDGHRDVANSGDGGDDAADFEPPTKLHAARPDSQAARTKAYREKQRRAQLNNRYTELAALIDPSKAPKTDRNLILEDAVRVIGQLRVENNQLRQLNKLLEERVQEQEAKRGHALYQQSVMMQGGLNPSSRADGASTSRGVVDAGGAALDVADVPSIPGPCAAGPASGANGPQMDQTSLAMSMMNMAMQLLQSKGMAPPHAAMPSGAAAMPSGAAQSAQSMWPMGMMPQVPQSMLPYMCPPVMGMQQQDASLKQHGDPMLMGHPGPTVNGEPTVSTTCGEGSHDGAATASVPAPPPGSKQPPLQPMGYSHGYNFPPMGSAPPGWPPANMVDQHRDSQLRPPAA